MASKNERQFRILVVEDNAVLLSLWRRILKGFGGGNHFYASNVEDAIKQIKNFDFDLLIADIILPELNGYEIAKIAKKKTPNIRIILTTGYGTNLKRFDLQNLKAHLIHKPYTNIEKLSLVVMHLLNNESPLDDADEDSFSDNEDYPQITEWTL